MKSKPKILLGIGREKTKQLDDLKSNLLEWSEVEVWKGIFDLSEITLAALESKLSDFDMCLFL